jgi:hypothetical protein
MRQPGIGFCAGQSGDTSGRVGGRRRAEQRPMPTVILYGRWYETSKSSTPRRWAAQGPPIRPRAGIRIAGRSGYDQPSEPPTGIQPGTLAVLFRVFATWRGAFGYAPDCPELLRVRWTAPPIYSAGMDGGHTAVQDLSGYRHAGGTPSVLRLMYRQGAFLGSRRTPWSRIVPAPWFLSIRISS